MKNIDKGTSNEMEKDNQSLSAAIIETVRILRGRVKPPESEEELIQQAKEKGRKEVFTNYEDGINNTDC